MELFSAHNQWSRRPADERFWDIQEGLVAAQQYKAVAVEKEVHFKDLRVEAVGTEIALTGRQGIPATLSHWSFGQLASRAKAPANYLRQLPATLAAQNLNFGLSKQIDDEVGQAMFHRNGRLVLRSLTSEKYTRIWNADVLDKLTQIPGDWRTPRAYAKDGDPRARLATAEDVMDGSRIKVGDKIGPAGVYVSAHDMYVFMIDPTRYVRDPKGNRLFRGVIAANSEVGAKRFTLAKFLFAEVCGNHIIWDARDIELVSVRHVGKADETVFRALDKEAKKFLDSGAQETESAFLKAMGTHLGATKAEAVKAITTYVAKRKLPITEKLAGEIIDLAETRTERYGSPYTVWAAVNGATELSQKSEHADDRFDLDRAASKLMDMAF